MSMNGATVRKKWDLGEIIEGCARHGIGGISPWRDQLAAYGREKAARQIADAGLAVSGLCRGGMFPAFDSAAREAALDDNLRAIEEAEALRAACLVLVVGGLPAGSCDLSSARHQVEDGLAALLPRAKAAAVPLAIEPLHPMYAADRSCVNTLKQALDICARVSPNDGQALGVAIDVYHLWWDPDLSAQIARAGQEHRILAFHVCDWLRETGDLLLDRGMMGDGVIDLSSIRQEVEAAGFCGLSEVEIFSQDNWWQRDPDDVLATCVERHKTVV